jgi:hypothetical protein
VSPSIEWTLTRWIAPRGGIPRHRKRQTAPTVGNLKGRLGLCRITQAHLAILTLVQYVSHIR